MYWLFLIGVLELGVTVAAQGPSNVDACRVQIPPALGQALLRRFMNYGLPSVSDTLVEDVEFDRSRGGSGCLLVTRADFDGDGREDVAVGLAPKTGRTPLVAVALARGRGWTLSTIQSWVDDLGRLYVTGAPPGTHTQAETLDGPLQQNERKSLRCNHQALVVGATESTGIAYCYVNTRWLYVWVSD